MLTSVQELLGLCHVSNCYGLAWGEGISAEGLYAKTSHLPGYWHWRQQEENVCFWENMDRAGRGS